MSEQNTPEKKIKKTKGLSHLMENNKFVFLISLIIAFLVWAMVAMYKSPSESMTINNVPITIDTKDSLIESRGYSNLWQSDDMIDISVTGPRYLISSLTADDFTVAANLNSVDSAGLADVDLRVSLNQNSQDISITSVSHDSIQVYFDEELEKAFDIEIDESAIDAHVADDYNYSSCEFTVSTVTLKGPATEVNKVVRVMADPQLSDELMYKTATLPISLSLEGVTAADTVSINRYVTYDNETEYSAKIHIDHIVKLTPTIEFKGTAPSNIDTTFSIESLNAKIDTESEFSGSEIQVASIDYSTLENGVNTITVLMKDIALPTGVVLTDDIPQLKIIITVSE